MKNEQLVAEKLLQIKAVKLNLEQPYTWASGWKSPIYCDNRKILSHPFVRDFIKSELCNLVFTEFEEANVVAGVATAGIPWGALIADQLKLPFVYVRSAPKAHGMGNQIEGELVPGSKVIVIEDLISTGKSSLQAVDALIDAGAEIDGMCAIFTYGFPEADKAFETKNIKYKTLSNYNALIEHALEKNIFAPKQIDILKNWRENPSEWNK